MPNIDDKSSDSNDSKSEWHDKKSALNDSTPWWKKEVILGFVILGIFFCGILFFGIAWLTNLNTRYPNLNNWFPLIFGWLFCTSILAIFFDVSTSYLFGIKRKKHKAILLYWCFILCLILTALMFLDSTFLNGEYLCIYLIPAFGFLCIVAILIPLVFLGCI